MLMNPDILGNAVLADPIDPVAPRRATKASADTVAGCTDMAAADIARSLTMDTANGRQRFEHSAAAWTARAGLLGRIERDAEGRKAAVIAKRRAAPGLA